MKHWSILLSSKCCHFKLPWSEFPQFILTWYSCRDSSAHPLGLKGSFILTPWWCLRLTSALVLSSRTAFGAVTSSSQPASCPSTCSHVCEKRQPRGWNNNPWFFWQIVSCRVNLSVEPAQLTYRSYLEGESQLSSWYCGR